MKKVLVWILIIISLAALLLRFSNKWAEVLFGIKQISGLSVLSQPQDATVFLDGKEVGKTPYDQKDLEVREYGIKIEKGSSTWQGKVRLTAGTITVVNRELASDSASSAGETLTLDRGKGLTVISNPSEADVEIDGKPSGKTPITINIDKGEHTLLISHANYLKRSVRVNFPADLNMTVSVDLGLSEADLSAITAPVITQTPQVLVKSTPTGFLRVRDKASLNGKEIAQVKPGDKLILLEEQSGWDRVRLPDNTEGYVSSAYVEKQNP